MSTKVNTVTIKFAGDSGDGMQLTGSQFTDNTALYGNDFATFPNFPAEIRAPQGTIHGVSGFQLHFGSTEINTPGDNFDVLVAMNAAALKESFKGLQKEGLLIIDEAGFDKKNLRLAGFNPDQNILEQEPYNTVETIKIDVSGITKETLIDSALDAKAIDRCKNMFVLGLVLWMYHRDTQSVEQFLDRRFAKNELLKIANVKVLKAGYYFGETAELSRYKKEVSPASSEKGLYRNITGNTATAFGLMGASAITKLPLFYGSYPITPASDILHELVKHEERGVQCFQAEDEIAAVSAAIGASYGGALGVTGTSGPGLALKSEAINLALMLELPLVVIDVQRAGPSTGMPTKTEQSDLLFAMYGRNGESPLPVIAAHSPSHCFEAIYWACKISIEFMTPVIFLSDGYIANGSEPWKLPELNNLPKIKPNHLHDNDDEGFLPYKRNDNLVRNWVVPGTSNKQHRIGGLEKEDITGNVSYDPENHEKMTNIRAQKVQNVSQIVPNQTYSMGRLGAENLLLGWGNTFGVLKSTSRELEKEGIDVAHIQVDFIHPFPANLFDLIKSHKNVFVVELNNGQLIKLLKSVFEGLNLIPINKIQGIPFKKSEIQQEVLSYLKRSAHV